MTTTANDYRIALSNDLPSFIHQTFCQLDPQTPYAENWHIELLADRLTQVLDGSIRRLIITVPPRSLKSICASVAFPAWALGRNPALRFICASYGKELSDKLARDCAAVMGSAWYQMVFDTRLAPHRSAAGDFETGQRGGRMATSVGGVLTGRGADIVIIDDPVKPEEAMSDAQRKAANDWFDNTLYTRLNDKRTGAIVLIMQRLHLDDMVGHVLEKEPWEIINLPAIAQHDEVWDYRTSAGPKQHRRSADELLHPEREPAAVLDAMRQMLGESAFSAQYLQSPVPLGGGLIKAEWLHRYDSSITPENFTTIVQSWDSANKASQLSDYSVCTTWGQKDNKAYLLHVLRQRMEYPELKRTVIAHAQAWNANTILIEDKASGTQLIQELARGELPAVKGVKPAQSKVMRMQAQSAHLENGFVLFPERAPWLDAYILELTTFPQSRHDDQVDSTSQALEWISVGKRSDGLLVYYRQLYAENWQANGWPELNTT